jgi:hypothetical protein
MERLIVAHRYAALPWPLTTATNGFATSLVCAQLLPQQPWAIFGNK